MEGCMELSQCWQVFKNNRFCNVFQDNFVDIKGNICKSERDLIDIGNMKCFCVDGK